MGGGWKEEEEGWACRLTTTGVFMIPLPREQHPLELRLMLARHALSMPHLSGPVALSGVWLPSYGRWRGRGGDQWHLGRRGCGMAYPSSRPPASTPVAASLRPPFPERIQWNSPVPCH